MLKHVHVSSLPSRPASISFSSSRQSKSFSSTTTTTNSRPEFEYDSRRSSISNSSFSSSSAFSSASFLNISFSSLQNQRRPLKIFAQVLRSDIEYKTLSVSLFASSSDVIRSLLNKCKMRHKDPKLYYLALEVQVLKRSGSEFRLLVLEDDAKPGELEFCQPWGSACKFSLKTRKGGLIRIHDSILRPESNYKALFVSENTTVREIISLLLTSHGLNPRSTESYDLFERSNKESFQRRLSHDDVPFVLQSLWPSFGHFAFVLQHRSPQRSSERDFSQEPFSCKPNRIGVPHSSSKSLLSSSSPHQISSFSSSEEELTCSDYGSLLSLESQISLDSESKSQASINHCSNSTPYHHHDYVNYFYI